MGPGSGPGLPWPALCYPAPETPITPDGRRAGSPRHIARRTRTDGLRRRPARLRQRHPRLGGVRHATQRYRHFKRRRLHARNRPQPHGQIGLRPSRSPAKRKLLGEIRHRQVKRRRSAGHHIVIVAGHTVIPRPPQPQILRENPVSDRLVRVALTGRVQITEIAVRGIQQRPRGLLGLRAQTIGVMTRRWRGPPQPRRT